MRSVIKLAPHADIPMKHVVSFPQLACAIGISAVLGCASPATYGPIGDGRNFGYRDTRNPDGSYTVLVIAPTSESAHAFWDQRATELCDGGTYRKNFFRAEIPVVTQYGYAANPYNPGYGGSYSQDVRGAPILEGYLHCDAAVAPD